MHDDGGFSMVSKNNKWGKITFRLGYSDGSSLGYVLQQHYEKILFPYDVFLTKLRDAKVKVSQIIFRCCACQRFVSTVFSVSLLVSGCLANSQIFIPGHLNIVTLADLKFATL